MDFRLAEGLDPHPLSEIFARNRRMQIDGFLDGEDAVGLLRFLATSPDWVLTLNQGEKIYDYSREAFARLTPGQRAALSRDVALGGRQGFQYCYDTIRLPARGEPRPETPLADFERFMSSGATLDFVRTVTGIADMDFADAHASRYGPGHFLSTHDDRSDDMGRRVAYVMNLSPDWRPDWGGMLVFYDERGNITRGFRPGFNILNIFTVPQAHSVTWVTPLAARPRLAITGWFRSER